MAKRKIIIKNAQKVPINERALRKLILYYYKGKNNVEINFDNRLSAWADHRYDSSTKTHTIRISPIWCSFDNETWMDIDFEELHSSVDLVELNKFDMTCRVIVTILHELKHAEQCDKNPIRYAKCRDDRHPIIKNHHLKYKLSELESEAEGWALLNFSRALERYERWYNERAKV